MPVGSETKNGRQDSSKTNGEEESSNSEDESSFCKCECDKGIPQFQYTPLTCLHTAVDDEDDTERRKGDCLEDIQYLEQQFTDLKEM